MGKAQEQQGHTSIFKRLRRPQHASTSISSSLSAIDQQQKDCDFLMNQLTSNEKQSKYIEDHFSLSHFPLRNARQLAILDILFDFLY